MNVHSITWNCYLLLICLRVLIFLYYFILGDAIRCYQCSSDQESKDEDNCGAYEYFDTEKNSQVDCLGEEAVTPGTFCYKSIQQSPRGFICKFLFTFLNAVLVLTSNIYDLKKKMENCYMYLTLL